MAVTVSPKLQEWRQYFAQVAKMCSEKVKHLPRGQRRQAFLECMRQYLWRGGRNPAGPG